MSRSCGFAARNRTVERARQASREGRLDEAIQSYRTAIANSPDSPFLYREFGAVELRKGQTDEALASFRKAVALDPSDATSHAQIGEILDSRNDFEGAERAYTAALANGAGGAVTARLEALRGRAARARLPAEYRAIDQAAQITRADLAALIAVRLSPLLESVRRSDSALMTDVRNHWAAQWIFAVTRAGVMEPFDNHAFQPRAVVRRIELAQAVAPPAAAGGHAHARAGAGLGGGAAALQRPVGIAPRVSGGVGGRRGGRHENRRRQRVSAFATGDGP